MNILELLEGFQKPKGYIDVSKFQCAQCEGYGGVKENDNCSPDCELKAAIDDLRSGRVVMVVY